MPSCQLTDTAVTWITNEKELDIKSYQQLQPSSLISNLSSLFKSTVSYYSLSKQEALDTIGYMLYENDDIVHLQLFDCFINNQLLFKPFEKAKYFTINQTNNSGVFMPLTKCYSPSCQLNQPNCYSPLCPNKRTLNNLRIVNQHNKEQESSKYWIESIPNYIRDSTNRKELKRQAGIAELILTEQNYCQDLDILHQVYAIPLLESTEIICNPSRRQRFYNNVFGNYLDITHLHHSFYNQLNSLERQSSFFIGRIGTIILQHVTNLIEPYICYASNHAKAIYCMTIEYKSNLQFSKFLSSRDALKCTRRLGLRHYLTSPTLWIGKFKLMIEAILKNTQDDADQLSLKASLAILHDTLCRMNTCAKLSPENYRFEELLTSIYTTVGTELLVIPEDSELLLEEEVWLARSTHPLQPTLCHVFLFSHALVLTHPRITNTRTEYIVIPGSPIPIQLLSLHNSNATTSMIRKLSFASTSMVSTPMHLLSNLRRQKSINSDTSNNSSNSSSSTITNNNNTTNKLGRSNTTIHVVSTNKPIRRSVTIEQQRRNYRILPHIKKRLSILKNRWSTSIIPVPNNTTTTTAPVTRRDSAPALLLSNHKVTEINSIQQRRRTLNISHMAYPENAFKLEFLTRANRLIWEDLIKQVIHDSDKSNHYFKSKLVCNGLPNSCGKIKCAYAFAYSDGNSMVVIGTQNGVWLGPRDESKPFKSILPNQNVQQLNILNDKLVVMRQEDKHNLLVAYSLKSIMNETELDWCIVKRSFVICFTVGKIRNQSVIVYLAKKLQTIWLTIIIPNENTTINHHWFKKYKMEYKVSIKDPTDVQIIRDTIFIRSDRYGIERIDITLDQQLQQGVNYIFMGSNIGLLSSKRSNNFVCNSQYAYSVSLFDRYNNDCKGLIRAKFESQAYSVAIIYPYLIAFSPSVIEIRSIETTVLLQAIRGSQIQFLSNMNDLSQPLFFSMLNQDKISTSIYQLQLSLLKK